MKTNDKHYIIWKTKQDIKKFHRYILKKNRKKQRIKEQENSMVALKKNSFNDLFREEKFQVPENFSIINNPNETVAFFNKIYGKIDENPQNVKFYLDMSYVKQITVDALIYLIALIKNIRQMSTKILSVGGNMPKNYQCRVLVSESGFLDHVQTTNISTKYNNNKIRIRSGGKFEPRIIKEVIDFIREDEKALAINTKSLYTLIGEIMNNSIHHAYDGGEEYEQKWLIFVEKTDFIYKFTLLDTGLGIPVTVNKKFIFDNFSSDCNLLKSALEGTKLRTQTKQLYRGKGLPEIRQQVLDGLINTMSIISCKASCKLLERDKFIEDNDLNSSLRGTLYYWEIKKNEEVQNDYN